LITRMSKLNLNDIPMDDEDRPKGRQIKKENKQPKLTDKTKKPKGK
jgi:hypothetical protein